MYMYIYIYTYIHIDVYIYIYIYTHTYDLHWILEQELFRDCRQSEVGVTWDDIEDGCMRDFPILHTRRWWWSRFDFPKWQFWSQDGTWSATGKVKAFAAKFRDERIANILKVRAKTLIEYRQAHGCAWSDAFLSGKFWCLFLFLWQCKRLNEN